MMLLLAAGAETATSSVAPHVELLTMGRGGYLYSYWGHAALRVVRPGGEDLAYNFGGLDAEEDVWSLLRRGHTLAFPYRTTFADLLATYSGEDRTITRRTLALSPKEAEALAAHLANLTSGPGRAKYVYDHFHDNCATRIADELDRALEGKLRAASTDRAPGTFRTRALQPIRGHPLLYVALDLAMSSAADRPITRFETAFQVEGLAALLEATKLPRSATTAGALAEGVPLASAPTDLYRSVHFDDDRPWTWPWIDVYLFFGVPAALLAFFAPRLGARLLGLTFGLLGLGLAILSATTSYDFLSRSWDVLVLPPTHVLLALAPGRLDRLLAAYLRVHAGILAALLAASSAGLVAPAIGPALGLALPLGLVLAVRIGPRLRVTRTRQVA